MDERVHHRTVHLAPLVLKVTSRHADAIESHFGSAAESLLCPQRLELLP